MSSQVKCIKVIMRYNVSEDVIYANQESILKGYRTLKRRLFSIKRIVLWSSDACG